MCRIMETVGRDIPKGCSIFSPAAVRSRQVDEHGDANAEDGKVAEEVDELEREEGQVNPDGAA